jgi:putative membrane protein
MRNRKRPRPNPVLGALAGAAGGMVGSWAMVRFNHLIDPGTGTSDKPGDRHAHRRSDARPNDTDGTITDEPGSMQLASAVAEPMLGRPLTPPEKEIGGPIMHYLFGAAAGAAYGAAAEVDGSVTRAAGIPYGIAVWLIADEIGMHAAGFATKPTDYPPSRHAAALATHLVFGLSVEAVRRALRGSQAERRRG